MPVRVLLVGLLYVLSGLSAIWDVITEWMNSTVSLNFAVFLLPVGIGLLRGKPSSRRWAVRWVILGYLLCGLIAVLAVLSPETSHANWLGERIEGSEAVPYLLGMLALILATLVLVHLTLESAVARAWFGEGEPRELE